MRIVSLLASGTELVAALARYRESGAAVGARYPEEYMNRLGV